MGQLDNKEKSWFEERLKAIDEEQMINNQHTHRENTDDLNQPSPRFKSSLEKSNRKVQSSGMKIRSDNGEFSLLKIVL